MYLILTVHRQSRLVFSRMSKGSSVMMKTMRGAVQMKTTRGAVPAARRLASLVLVSCTLARHSCNAFVSFVSPAASSPRTADNTAHAANGVGGCWTTAAAASGLRAGAGDVVGEEAVLAKFKRLQV